MRNPLPAGASNLVHLRGNGSASDQKHAVSLPGTFGIETQQQRHEWPKSGGEKEIQPPNCTAREEDQQTANAANNPDDLLDRLTHNLLESSLKRLSTPKVFRKPFGQLVKNQELNEQVENSGLHNGSFCESGQTSVSNIGIYFSYTKSDHSVVGSRDNPLSTPLDGKCTQMHHLTRRSSNGKLESIEEVNEIESLKTGTEKRECTIQEALDFKAEEEVDIALCTAENNLTDRIKRLVVPTNSCFRSSEVNPTQETLNLSRAKIFKNRLKKQITRTAEYGNQIIFPSAVSTVHNDICRELLDPWACKSFERNQKSHEISFKRLKNLGTLTLNENRVGSTKSPNGRRPSLTVLKPRVFPLRRIPESHKKHNDSLFKTDRSQHYPKRFLTGYLAVHKRLSTSLAENGVPKLAKEVTPEHHIKFHGTDTKTFKRLVSFTTSDTMNSKATKKDIVKCFVPHQKNLSHSTRLIGHKTANELSFTRPAQFFNREQNLLSKLNLKTPTSRQFEGAAAGSDIVDDACSIGTQKTYEVRKSTTKASCLFKRQADQPYKLTPYASKLIADTFNRRFQKQRHLKDPANVYQDLVKRGRPITDDFFKPITKYKSRKASIDMHKCDFEL